MRWKKKKKKKIVVGRVQSFTGGNGITSIAIKIVCVEDGYRK